MFDFRVKVNTELSLDGSDYTQEGVENFRDFITDKGLYESFLRGTYQVMVVQDAGKIVGIPNPINATSCFYYTFIIA